MFISGEETTLDLKALCCCGDTDEGGHIIMDGECLVADFGEECNDDRLCLGDLFIPITESFKMSKKLNAGGKLKLQVSCNPFKFLAIYVKGNQTLWYRLDQTTQDLSFVATSTITIDDVTLNHAEVIISVSLDQGGTIEVTELTGTITRNQTSGSLEGTIVGIISTAGYSFDVTITIEIDSNNELIVCDMSGLVLSSYHLSDDIADSTGTGLTETVVGTAFEGTATNSFDANTIETYLTLNAFMVLSHTENIEVIEIYNSTPDTVIVGVLGAL